MAPSKLDTTRNNDRVFAQTAKNGLVITCAGEQPPGGVIAYDERAGTVDIMVGGNPMTVHGDVRAAPGF